MITQVRSVLLVPLIVLALVSCITLREPVPVEEAKQAYVFSINVVTMVTIGIAFGQKISGVTVNEDAGEIQLEQMNIRAAGGGPNLDPYTEVSGSIRTDGDRTHVRLELVGGPVQTIVFDFKRSVIQNHERRTATARINGRVMELELTGEEFPR